MSKIAISLTLLASALACAPAQAQNRTYTAVSAAVGLPSPGPCGAISSPCRTLQAAFNATAENGVIDVLTPGDYGLLSITHAVSIQGHGWTTVTAPSGAYAIVIGAGASDKINIRGVLVDGAGTGAIGIQFNSGASLTIQDSVIRNFGANFIGEGINLLNTGSQLYVSNTLVSDNNYGISMFNAGGGTLKAVLDEVRIENNITGVYVSGLFVTNVMVRNSTIANNSTGLNANGSGAIILVTRSTIAENATGWQTLNGGVLFSYADNNIVSNAAGQNAPPAIGYE